MSPGVKMMRGSGAAILVGLVVLGALLLGDFFGGGE